MGDRLHQLSGEGDDELGWRVLAVAEQRLAADRFFDSGVLVAEDRDCNCTAGRRTRSRRRRRPGRRGPGP
jgi:hypothetical protein